MSISVDNFLASVKDQKSNMVNKTNTPFSFDFEKFIDKTELNKIINETKNDCHGVIDPEKVNDSISISGAEKIAHYPKSRIDVYRVMNESAENSNLSTNNYTKYHAYPNTDNSSNNADFLHGTINDEKYSRIEISINAFSFLFSSKFSIIEIFNLILQNFVELSITVQNFIKTGEELKDLSDYYTSLINEGGDGYLRMYDEEIDNLEDSFFELYSDILTMITDEINRSFLLYEHSTVKDFSIVNGVKCYDWKPYSHSSIISIRKLFIGSLINYIGKEFCSQKLEKFTLPFSNDVQAQ